MGKWLQLSLAAVVVISSPILISLYLDYQISQVQLPPEATYTFQEHCEAYGYDFEQYEFTTRDQYRITLYRIPGKNGNKQKGPVLMLHGVSNSSNCFIVNMCTKPPAFIMADAHFDVWFLNHRGTHISRGHETLNPETDDEYWEFNMAEMVLYDLPDSISFIKQYTGVEKLGLIGHSQGGMVVLWAISLIPEIEKDVTVAVCMGVTAGLIRTKSFYLDTITSSWFISLLKLTGEKVYSDWSDDTWLAKFVYLYPSVADYLGQDIFDIDLNGGDPKNLAVYTHRIRGGTSLANLECWKDVKEKGNLFPEMCDQGPEINLKKYGRHEPYIVDFRNIKTKVAVISGRYDLGITQEDTELLREQIPQDKLIYFTNDLPTDHGGLILSCDLTIFNTIIELLSNNID